MIPLSDLNAGQKGVIKKLREQLVTLKLLEMGFLPGVNLKLVRKAPMGSPLYVRVKTHFVALRKEEAEVVLVEVVDHE